MRLPDTQTLTDGEIYWVIANGIRLTGMPAWGPGGPDDPDTWKLVHFIRRLKDLTPDDLRTMKGLLKTAGEFEEEGDRPTNASSRGKRPGSRRQGHIITIRIRGL